MNIHNKTATSTRLHQRFLQLRTQKKASNSAGAPPGVYDCAQLNPQEL